MKYLNSFLSSLLILITSFVYSQSQCDCRIVPYRPDSCFNICAGNILRNATDIDLELVLGLNDTLTNKILEINKNSTTISLGTYLSAFSEVEKEKLVESIKGLNKEQNEYLNKPFLEKKSTMANMQESIQYKKPG